jgi:hypothetical protein
MAVLCASTAAGGVFTGPGATIAGACAAVFAAGAGAATLLEVAVECGTDPTSEACYKAAGLAALGGTLGRASKKMLDVAQECDDVLRFAGGLVSSYTGWVVTTFNDWWPS